MRGLTHNKRRCPRLFVQVCTCTYLSGSDDDIHDGDVREGKDSINSSGQQRKHDGVAQAAVQTENKKICHV